MTCALVLTLNLVFTQNQPAKSPPNRGEKAKVLRLRIADTHVLCASCSYSAAIAQLLPGVGFLWWLLGAIPDTTLAP